MSAEPSANPGAFGRVIWIVLDSVGIGAMPDAAAYGDAGSDTLGNIARRRALHLPNLAKLGLGNLKPLPNIVLTIRGEDDALLLTGEIGEVCVAGPSVMLGYLGDAQATDLKIPEVVAARRGEHRTADEKLGA